MSRYRSDSVSYSQAHLRLKVDRGPASRFICRECSGPAAEWAYMGGDPDEFEWDGKKYSVDQSRYEPMCVRCHRRHDRALADGRSIDVCPQGHPWSEHEGLRVKRGARTGLRFCRACNRENTRRWRDANRERINASRRKR